MSMRDVEEQNTALFRSLCEFVWVQGDPLPLIYEPNHYVYVSRGIDQAALISLHAAGLISYEADGYVKGKFGKHTRLFYFGRRTKIQFNQETENKLDIGHVVLTEKGKALAVMSNAKANEDFYQYVIERWAGEGLITSTILQGAGQIGGKPTLGLGVAMQRSCQSR